MEIFRRDDWIWPVILMKFILTGIKYIDHWIYVWTYLLATLLIYTETFIYENVVPFHRVTIEEASCSCTLGHKIRKGVVTKLIEYLMCPLFLWDLLFCYAFFTSDKPFSPRIIGNFSSTLVVLFVLSVGKQAAALPPFRSFVKREPCISCTLK